MKIILFSLMLLVACSFLIRWLVVVFSPSPATLYDGQALLSPCPSSPNCVCSTDLHSIEALEGDAQVIFKQLIVRIKNHKNASIISHTKNYLHAEFRTPLMGFIDDLEILALADEGLVHLRSASRLGHSDFGVNKKRVETLVAKLN
jgi:uncharacterized protein (DUF1499 family)